MLNEAIIQSVLEQSKNDDKGGELALPSQQEEEQMLKEVLKMSAFEYQKETGQVRNLDFLKRNKKPKKEEDTGQNLIMGNMTDAQLAQIAKMNAPRKLGAITVGAKKPPSALRVKPTEFQGEAQHIESTATMMGMQSLKTNDNTAADQMNPSMAHLQREIDEDSILRDVIGKHKQSTTILSSNKKSLINE